MSTSYHIISDHHENSIVCDIEAMLAFAEHGELWGESNTELVVEGEVDDLCRQIDEKISQLREALPITHSYAASVPCTIEALGGEQRFQVSSGATFQGIRINERIYCIIAGYDVCDLIESSTLHDGKGQRHTIDVRDRDKIATDQGFIYIKRKKARHPVLDWLSRFKSKIKKHRGSVEIMWG